MFNSYFEGDYILSKGALINFVLSDRSDGKTFDCKYRCLRDYQENRSITIYLRRYKSEITPLMYNSWFDEVLSKPKGKPFKNWKFKGSKRGIQVQLPNSDEWEFIVYFIVLSMSCKLKSQITEIDRIHIIDYDEFVPLDFRYLKDEIDIMLEFYKSIDRDRYTTQLLILGNKLTPFNPLFDYFGIKLKIEKEKVKLYRNGSLAVQIYANKEHREERDKSKFASLIEGTAYEGYAKGGILYNLGLKIGNHNGMNYWCSFKTSKGEGSIWYDDNNFCVSDTLRKDSFVLVDKLYNTGREEYMVNFGKFGSNLKNIYRTNKLLFENEKTYYAFEDILLKIGAA